MFSARGAYLYPNDVHVSQSPSVTNVQLATGPDALLNAQYLRVTFGTACSTNPYSDRYCLRCGEGGGGDTRGRTPPPTARPAPAAPPARPFAE